jgi:hypothetical protein
MSAAQSSYCSGVCEKVEWRDYRQPDSHRIYLGRQQCRNQIFGGLLGAGIGWQHPSAVRGFDIAGRIAVDTLAGNADAVAGFHPS